MAAVLRRAVMYGRGSPTASCRIGAWCSLDVGAGRVEQAVPKVGRKSALGAAPRRSRASASTCVGEAAPRRVEGRGSTRRLGAGERATCSIASFAVFLPSFTFTPSSARPKAAMKFAILVLCGRAAADLLPLPEPTVILYEQDAREDDTLLLCWLLGGVIASFAATQRWRDVREKLRSLMPGASISVFGHGRDAGVVRGLGNDDDDVKPQVLGAVSPTSTRTRSTAGCSPTATTTSRRHAPSCGASRAALEVGAVASESTSQAQIHGGRSAPRGDEAPRRRRRGPAQRYRTVESSRPRRRRR